LGNEAGGAKRWLDLGFLKFQPSEVARLALIIYLAYSLEKKQKLVDQFSIGIVPHLVVLIMFSAVLLSQPDFGSIIIFWALSLIMMFIGGVKIIHLAGILLPAAIAGWWFMTFEEYRLDRILMFLDPWKYATTLGYQTIHSLMAFGTGGIFGVGLGKGYQKLFYLPEPHTDFIFSVIGEELGMVGVLIIISLYIVILHRGLVIARNATDIFGCFVAMGITVAMGLQICINMGVALGMLPTKGLTLPFVSYGGSSLLLNMAAIGILMNIAADTYKKAQD
jgi:cell division protein FtsW